jgi:uncharacterized protein YdhG (YjbR/CyaY superfamily)
MRSTTTCERSRSHTGDDFEAETAGYKRAKGSVQFPSKERLPVGLIKKLVKARLAENKDRYRTKKKR